MTLKRVAAVITCVGLVVAAAVLLGRLAPVTHTSSSVASSGPSGPSGPSGASGASSATLARAVRKAPPPVMFSARKAAPPQPSGPSTVPGETPPAQQCDIAYQRYGACYDYAGAQAVATNQGATVSFPVASPTLAYNGGHTLMEMAVFNRTAAGIDQDTAEIGWIVDPAPSGQAPVPQLFIYHFVNTEGTCYNGCGFVSTSSTIVPGMALTPGMNVTWSIRNIDGNWTFFFNGTEFGYIPESAYDGTFDSAAQVNVYGEIAGGGSTPGCSQMGDGLFGTQAGSATISDFQLNGASGNVGLTPYWPTDPAAWNSKVTPGGLRLGGPGDCTPAAGTVASADGSYTEVGQDTTAYTFAAGQNPWTRSRQAPVPQLTGAGQIIGVASDPATGGYWMADNQGDVYPVNAPDNGSLNGTQTPTPIVGITAFGSGDLLVTANGKVYPFNATSDGDLSATRLSAPVVGITAFESGYLIATADGKVYEFTADHAGLLGWVRPSAPVTGIAVEGNGYLLVDSRGDVYPWHTAGHGSLRGTDLPEPIIGITATSTGYLLTDTVGNVYAFGTALNGSMTNAGV